MKDEKLSIGSDMWTNINNVNIEKIKLSKVYYRNKDSLDYLGEILQILVIYS